MRSHAAPAASLAVLASALLGMGSATQPQAGPPESVPADGQSDGMCTENLMPNPSFEEGLTGWSIARGPRDYVTAEANVARTGKSSLCLKSPQAPEHVMLVGTHMPVRPWEPYRLHFFCRSDRNHLGPLFRVYPSETGGHQTPGRSYWLGCDGAPDWRGYYCDFVFPEDVGDVQITFCAGHWAEGGDRSGTCWIDDIEFGPATPLEPTGASNCSEGSIIFNGGFELGYGDQAFGWPVSFIDHGATYWTGFAAAPHYMGPDTKITWDKSGPYLGEHCLHIAYTGQDPQHKVVLPVTVYPEAGETYDIRFFGKTDGADGRVVFEPYGEENKWLFAACATRARPGDWQEHRLRYEPDDRTPVPCGLKLSIVLIGPGNVWIDELEMVPSGTGFGRGETAPATGPQPPPGEAKAGKAEADYQRGLELKRAGKLTEATEALRAAIAADPQHVEAHWVLAWVLIDLKDREGAAEQFRKVIELSPNTERATEAQQALDRLKQ